MLKEMVKSVKMQVKSKDTDIQRLNIKIKRLEKTAEIRENVINESIKSQSRLPNKTTPVPQKASSIIAPSPRI